MGERAYRAEVEIGASADTVFAVLADFESYPSWNPLTSRVDATLEEGAPVRMRVHLGGLTLTQVEHVREVTPPTRIVWGIRTAVPWLLRAERVQTVTPLGARRCRYATVDTIGGLLEPLVALLFGRHLREGFESMAQALRRRVEGL